MKKRDLLSCFAIVLFCLLLFFISNCLKISFLTQPKVIGLFVGAVFAYLIIRKREELKKIKKNKLLLALSIGLIAFLIVTILSVIINKKMELTYIFEIIRPIIYILSIIIFMYMFSKKNNRSFFNKCIYGTVIILFIVNIFQFYNLFNLNELYIKTIAPTQYKTLVGGYAYPRVVGLMSNPNVYGYVLSLINLYLFYLIVKNFKSNSKKQNIFLIILLLLNKVGIYLTGSRTSFIVCIIAEMIFVFYSFFKLCKGKELVKSFFKTCLNCLGVLVLEVAILFSLPNAFTWRVKALYSDSIHSWEVRKQTSKDIIDDLFDNDDKTDDNKKDDNTDKKDEPTIKDLDDDKEKKDKDKKDDSKEDDKKEEEPFKKEDLHVSIFGTGPIKDGFSFDNEWIHVFVIYGLFGVISFISIFVIEFFFYKKEKKLFQAFYLSIIILNTIYIITAGSFFSYNMFITLLMFIMYVYCGEVYEK